MCITRLNIFLIAALVLASRPFVLAQSGEDGSSAKSDKLISVLKSDAPLKEKVDACRELAMVGNKQAVPALAALLSDEKLSHMARYALEPIPDESVDAALHDALSKLKGRLLVGVISSLGVRRDAQAIEPLSKLVAGSDRDVAQAAARALGRIGTSEAAKVLTKRLNSAPDDQRAAVADGCLACAEALLARGKRDEALGLYALVGQADLPKHFRVAAMRGTLKAKQP